MWGLKGLQRASGLMSAYMVMVVGTIKSYQCFFYGSVDGRTGNVFVLPSPKDGQMGRRVVPNNNLGISNGSVSA